MRHEQQCRKIYSPHSRTSLRVWDVDIHKCVHLIEFSANDISCSFNPVVLPSGFFEIIGFVMRVENWWIPIKNTKIRLNMRWTMTYPSWSYKPQSGWSCHSIGLMFAFREWGWHGLPWNMNDLEKTWPGIHLCDPWLGWQCWCWAYHMKRREYRVWKSEVSHLWTQEWRMYLQGFVKLTCHPHSFLLNSNLHNFMSRLPVIVLRAVRYSSANSSMLNVEFQQVDMSRGIICSFRLRDLRTFYHWGRAIVEEFLMAKETPWSWRTMISDHYIKQEVLCN